MFSSIELLPPSLYSNNWIYLNILLPHYPQLSDHILNVIFIVLLILVAYQRKRYRISFNINCVEYLISFLQFYKFIIHKHEARHLIHDEVPSFGLLQRITKKSDIDYSPALHRLSVTGKMGARFLMTLNLL